MTDDRRLCLRKRPFVPLYATESDELDASNILVEEERGRKGQRGQSERESERESRRDSRAPTALSLSRRVFETILRLFLAAWLCRRPRFFLVNCTESRAATCPS